MRGISRCRRVGIDRLSRKISDAPLHVTLLPSRSCGTLAFMDRYLLAVLFSFFSFLGRKKATRRLRYRVPTRVPEKCEISLSAPPLPYLPVTARQRSTRSIWWTSSFKAFWELLLFSYSSWKSCVSLFVFVVARLFFGVNWIGPLLTHISDM